jgi:hypothetical protein
MADDIFYDSLSLYQAWAVPSSYLITGPSIGFAAKDDCRFICSASYMNHHLEASASEMAKHQSSTENRLKNMHGSSALQDIIRLH